MKAFTFRLDRVLHWRATQVTIQQAKASAAAGKLAGIENAIDRHKTEIKAGAAQISQGITGAALQSYAGFVAQALHHIKDLESQAAEAQKALDVELNLLKDANRKAQLLENLKESRQNSWQKEFDRETGAFADESFLYRSGQRSKPRRLQSGKQAGA